jgi:hypothetical protein
LHFDNTKYCISEETRGREKVTLVIDFRDAKQISSIANVRVSIDFLKVLQNHYPGIEQNKTTKIQKQ